MSENLRGGEASIVLIAEDTHRTEGYVTKDGGRTEQRFRIRILNKEIDVKDMGVVVKDMDINEMGVIKDIGLDKDMKIGTKDMKINEMGIIEDLEIKDSSVNRFRGNPSSGCSTNQNYGIILVILFLVLSFIRKTDNNNS